MAHALKQAGMLLSNVCSCSMHTQAFGHKASASPLDTGQADLTDVQ